MQKTIAWALCALWMLLIFVMSAMPGDVSGEQSGTLTRIVISVVETILGEDAAGAVDIELLELLIRKAAHMAEYAVLCLLFCRALRLSGARHPAALALLLSAAYAATDEFHQGFVDGRGPSPVDVMIDTTGAAIGCAIRSVWHRMRKLRTPSS